MNIVAGGVKGNSDLVGYFFLRAYELVSREGSLGLIAKIPLLKGDTRDMSLRK